MLHVREKAARQCDIRARQRALVFGPDLRRHTPVDIDHGVIGNRIDREKSATRLQRPLYLSKQAGTIVHMVNHIGQVYEVVRILRHRQAFTGRHRAFQLDSIETAELQRRFHHLRRYIGRCDQRALQREVYGRFSQTRPYVEQTFAGEASHLLKKETILHRCRRFKSFAHADGADVGAARPLVVKIGLALMESGLVYHGL